MTNIIEQILTERGPEIEKEMLKVIQKEGIPNLNDAIWYHLSTGGKRLRPVLAIVTCEALNGDVKGVIPFAAACELFHNWILVHDDIEDSDKVRRDQPTVWVKYGLDHGINIGDYMSEKVYELILSSKRYGVNDETTLRLIKAMTEAAVKTAEGQAMDINLRKNDNPTEAQYMNTVIHKTAYYLTVPMIGGAIVANASEKILKKIIEYGRKVGPAFQIADDLLDLTEGKGRLEIGSDIREGKRSIVVVHCVSKCKSEEKHKLFEILNKPREKTTREDILWVKHLFEKYDSIEYAQKKAKKMVEEAKKTTSDLPPGIRKVLNNFAEYMVERKR